MKKLNSFILVIVTIFFIQGCTKTVSTKKANLYQHADGEEKIYTAETLKEKLSNKEPIASIWVKREGKLTTKKERIELAKENQTILYKSNTYKLVGEKPIKSDNKNYKIPKNVVEYILVEKCGLAPNMQDLPKIIKTAINYLQKVSSKYEFSYLEFYSAHNHIWAEISYYPKYNHLKYMLHVIPSAIHLGG